MKQYKYHTVIHSADSGAHDKQSFSVLLIRSEIAYDINFFTYKTARINFAQLESAERKEVVINQDTADWLDRHITTAISKIRNTIRFAIPRNSRMASNEILESPSQFPIHLIFDMEWDGDPQALCDTVHDFVVKQCIADWSQHALINRADEFQATADEALREIHNIACSYSTPDSPTDFWDTPVGAYPTSRPMPISADHSQELLDAKEALIKATDQIKGKQDELVSGKTLKTINGQSLLGEGNIEIKTSTAPVSVSTEVDAYTRKEADDKFQPKGNYITEHQKLKTVNGQTLTGSGNIEIQGGTDAYTKSESDTKYVAKQAGKVLSSNDYTDTDKAKVASAITSHQSLEGKQDKLTAQQLANLNADHSQYLTSHQDISGKVDKVTGKGLSTNDYTNEDKSAVQNIAELSLQVNAKQDALVSGTNIKTINNESILGTGNISIQGGGGEPSAYIKSASVSGNTLTLINKDNTSTSYTPTIPSTPTWADIKPTDGIALTDLASTLQTSISRADTIYNDYISAQNLI